jgi:hypothetical protein
MSEQKTREFNGMGESWCQESIKWSPFLTNPESYPEGKSTFHLVCSLVIKWDKYTDAYGHTRPLLEPPSAGVGYAVTYEFDVATHEIPALLKSGALHVWTQYSGMLYVTRPEELPAGPCTKVDTDYYGKPIKTEFDSCVEAMGPAQVEVDKVYPLQMWSDVDYVLSEMLNWTHVGQWGSRQEVAKNPWINRGGHISDPNKQYQTMSYYESNYSTGFLYITYPLVFKQVQVPPEPEVPEGELPVLTDGIYQIEDGTKFHQTIKGPIPEE